MKPVDARQLNSEACIETGVCIIGAGAAGISVASQLIDEKIDVCLVESGDFKLDTETQELYRLNSVGYPLRDSFINRARYFGGSSNLWAGRSMRLDPIDFETRDWISDSGWPISHQALIPYYRRAESLLKLPEVAMDKLINRDTAESALFSGDTLQPKLITWAKTPLRFRTAFGKKLIASRNIQILLNANVTELVPDDTGVSIKSAEVRTLDGRQIRIKAQHYVLACGGIENPRLLLCSQKLSSAGLANSHDLVGRYFMEHPRAIHGRVQLTQPLSVSSLLGMPLPDGKVQLGVGFSDAVQQRDRLLNGYLGLEPEMSELTQRAYESSASVAKVIKTGSITATKPRLPSSPSLDLIYLLTPKEVMPHFMYQCYAKLKLLRQKLRKITTLTILNFIEQAPKKNSRVYLSSQRDRLGMQVPTLDWKVGEEEVATLVRMQQLLDQQLRLSGMGFVEKLTPNITQPRFTDASHHMGTTRMSHDPKLGVVNSDSRAHGIDNLYVIGSSVFPTVGCGNPTLTIVALALRLADFLKLKK